MGASLVVVGISLIVSLFSSAFSVELLSKLSPLILVFLGIEVLIQNFFNKTGKIKYDFLSGVVCFLLISGSVVAYSVPYALSYYGPQREYLERRLSDEAEETCYAVLSAENISSMNMSVHLYPAQDDKVVALNALKGNGKIYAHFELPDDFASPAEFSQTCKGIADKLVSTNLPFSQIQFESSDEDNSYSLSLSDKFQHNMTAQEMEALIVHYNYEKNLEE